jgi:hypothetical protein
VKPRGNRWLGPSAPAEMLKCKPVSAACCTYGGRRWTLACSTGHGTEEQPSGPIIKLCATRNAERSDTHVGSLWCGCRTVVAQDLNNFRDFLAAGNISRLESSSGARLIRDGAASDTTRSRENSVRQVL